MRYISPFARLKLYRKNGDLAYSFEQHELVIGLPTSTSDVIVPLQSPDTLSLMTVYDTPLSGSGDPNLELCGLGYLNWVNSGWRNFYESPWTQSVNAVTLDTYWLVNAGVVNYNNKDYYPGDVIKLASGDSLSLSGSTYVSQWFFPGMITEEGIDRSAVFRMKNLYVGDESPNYWTWANGGYQPTNSLVSTDPNFFGWVR